MENIANIKRLKGEFVKIPVLSEFRMVNGTLTAKVDRYIDMPVEYIEGINKSREEN